MPTACPECGATLSLGQDCEDLYHALLRLEFEAVFDPDESSIGLDEIAHFYAVSSYILQHPIGMKYTVNASASLLQNVEDHFSGRAILRNLRQRVGRSANGPMRILRRSGDPEHS